MYNNFTVFFGCTILQFYRILQLWNLFLMIDRWLTFCCFVLATPTHHHGRSCLRLRVYVCCSTGIDLYPSIHQLIISSIDLFYFSVSWSTCQPIYEVHSVRFSLTLLSVFLRIKSICLRRKHTLSLSFPTRFHILMLLFGTTVIPNWELLEKIEILLC